MRACGRGHVLLQVRTLEVFTFSRDAQGRVTGYTYSRFDGQEFHARKDQVSREKETMNRYALANRAISSDSMLR